MVDIISTIQEVLNKLGINYDSINKVGDEIQIELKYYTKKIKEQIIKELPDDIKKEYKIRILPEEEMAQTELVLMSKSGKLYVVYVDDSVNPPQLKLEAVGE